MSTRINCIIESIDWIVNQYLWVRNKIRKITYLVGDVWSVAEDPEFEDELELLKLKKLNWLKKSSIFIICLLWLGVCLSIGTLILFFRFFNKTPLFSDFDSDIGLIIPLFPEAFNKTSACWIFFPSSEDMVKQYKTMRQIMERKMAFIHIFVWSVLKVTIKVWALKIYVLIV